MKNAYQTLAGMLILLFGISPTIQAEETDVNIPGLSIFCETKNSQLVPYEPVCLFVTISNNTAAMLPVPKNWQSMIRVQLTTQEGAEWQDITKWWQPAISQPPLPPGLLSTNQTESVNVLVYAFDPKFKLILELDHTYYVRVCLHSSNPSVDIASEKRTLSVTKPLANEQSAYMCIATNRSLLKFLAPIQKDGDVSASSFEVNDYVRRFSSSRYSEYLRFSYLVYSNKLEFSGDQKLVQVYRAELITSSPWLDRIVREGN